jgi:hypothetical protein
MPQIVKEMKNVSQQMTDLAWMIQNTKNIDPRWEHRALQLDSAATTLNTWAEAEEQLEQTIQIDEEAPCQ